MSLIRGFRGKFPCPICLVPGDELADISKTWPQWTAAHTQELLNNARGLNKTDRENLLSKNGIRNINVSFLNCFTD
jgi:hypothetical protein